MIIFLRQVPEDTVKYEVIEFLRPALKPKLFQTKGEIEQVNILALKDTQTNQSEYHVLVSIEPEEAGRRVIKKLNRKCFKGKLILVREYIHRSWQNDKRMSLQEMDEELMENRKNSRRRSTMEEIKGHRILFNKSILEQ